MAEVLVRGPEVAREPVCLWPAEGFPNVKGCGPRKRATEVIFQNWRNWKKNWALKGTRTKKQKKYFLDLWENITSSRALLFSNTYLLFIHFLRSGWLTWKLHPIWQPSHCGSIQTAYKTEENLSHQKGWSNKKILLADSRFSLRLSLCPNVSEGLYLQEKTAYPLLLFEGQEFLVS